MTVGNRIKKRREELGLTQEELAQIMGYRGKTSVCAAEKSGDNITTTKVHKFADALGVSFRYLMGYEEELADFSIFENIVLSANYEIWDNENPDNHAIKWNSRFEWEGKTSSDTVMISKRNHKDEFIFERILSIKEISYLTTLSRNTIFNYIENPNSSFDDLLTSVPSFENFTDLDKEIIEAFRNADTVGQTAVLRFLGLEKKQELLESKIS